MQRSNLYISQANLSPPVFTQSTSTSSFIAVYSYSRVSNQIEVRLKFADQQHPLISFKQNENTCSKLAEQIAAKLNENEQINKKNQSNDNHRLHVDALRGSLPVSVFLAKEMVLVQPNSTDKQTALQKENLIQTNELLDENQWFDTRQSQNQTSDCSICCESLTFETAYELLPCKSLNSIQITYHLNIFSPSRSRSSHSLPFMFNFLHSYKCLLNQYIACQLFSIELFN